MTIRNSILVVMMLLVFGIAFPILAQSTPAPGKPPVLPTSPGAATGLTDVAPLPGGAVAPADKNIADALAGYRDYEVSYDTTKTKAENTPKELVDLGVQYVDSGPEVAKTDALRGLNLVDTLHNRYDIVEKKFAADPEKDFDPNDTDRTLNYQQPRGDPFVIPQGIPEELRPELKGTGLDGTVDPKLLEQLKKAEYEANLRVVPIYILGVIKNGNYSTALYSIWGTGYTRQIAQGQSKSEWWGGPFIVVASQISEDFVIFTLYGVVGRSLTAPVVRTFHTPK